IVTMAFIACAASAAFLSSTRTPALLLAALVLTMAVSARRTPTTVAGVIFVVIAVGYVISSDARFRRYETLGTEGVLAERIEWSVNRGLLDVIADAPLGHGLASAGGTSIPYFLAEDALPQEGLESEVSRLALELGIVGLAAWSLFAFTTLVRGAS